MQQEKTPKVSVCVVTYNQEKYIRQCLQSIVDQETDFDFEVIVSDDCSTDGTRAIVQELADRYPGVVKPIFHEKNMGAYKNFVFVHEQAIGEYIAHIDGDDYALPGKLQAQANILDSNPNCNIVWHRMKIENTATKKLYDDLIDVKKFRKPELYRADLLEYGTISAHSSKMYRATENTSISSDGDVLDYYLDVIQIGDGFAIVVDDFLGVYRYGIGIAANSGKTKNLYLSHLKYFLTKFPQHKTEIGTNALWCFLVDLKHLRLTTASFFKLWIKSFSFASLFRLLTSIHIRKMLRSKVWN
jgi:glycosyltransferase involved in cell wall biosynthesis